MARTAAELLWAALRAEGAEFVFGLPGSQTIEAFQPLKRSGLRTIVPTHEMAAAFMANGYARVSGRPGIVTTIPGPGLVCPHRPRRGLARLGAAAAHRAGCARDRGL